MYDDDYGYEMEAIEQERFDADMLQAQYEAEGREFGRKQKLSERLRAEGKLVEAAEACPHSGGYPLASLAAEHANDPHVGEDGYRCCDCGSRMSASPWDGATVTVPCEVAAR
jgi:hypothetical protein